MASKTEEEPAVVVIESEGEPFTHEPYVHPLLDGDAADYQHAPATAGVDYAGELTDEEAEPKRSARRGPSSLAR